MSEPNERDKGEADALTEAQELAAWYLAGTEPEPIAAREVIKNIYRHIHYNEDELGALVELARFRLSPPLPKEVPPDPADSAKGAVDETLNAMRDSAKSAPGSDEKVEVSRWWWRYAQNCESRLRDLLAARRPSAEPTSDARELASWAADRIHEGGSEYFTDEDAEKVVAAEIERFAQARAEDATRAMNVAIEAAIREKARAKAAEAELAALKAGGEKPDIGVCECCHALLDAPQIERYGESWCHVVAVADRNGYPEPSPCGPVAVYYRKPAPSAELGALR